MSGSSTISITINAADLASAKFDALTKQILGLQGAAGQAGGAVRKMGDPVPLARLAEGMQAFGNNTLAAARAVERVASPMALLTGAGSIAGIVELSRRWAEMGNTVLKTATALDMPVGQLSNMTMAARVAGSTADAMNASLNGVFQTIKDAQFKIGDSATPIWQQLGINPLDEHGNARNPADVLRDYAEAMKGMDAHRRYTIELAAHIDPNLDPFLKDGGEGFDAAMKRAERTGGAWTDKMAEDARALRSSWNELGETLEGVFNRIEDKWEPFQQQMLDGVSHWIEKNQELATSLTEVLGPAITSLTLIKPAMWLLRLLGLEAVAAPVLPAAAATASIYELAHIPSTQTQAQEDAILGGSFAQRHPGNVLGPAQPGGGPLPETYGPPLPAYLGGPVVPPPPGGWPSTTLPPPAPPTAAPQASDQPPPTLPAAPPTTGESPIPPEGRALLNTIARTESGGRWGAIYGDPAGVQSITDFSHHPHIGRLITSGPNKGLTSSAAGGLQMIGSTWDDEQRRLGLTDFGKESQMRAGWDLAQRTYSEKTHRDLATDLRDPMRFAQIGAALHGQWTSLPAGIEATTTSERFSQDLTANEAQETGRVHVTIDLHGAPAGTTAAASATGAASVAPPRVATAMGHIS